MANFEQSAFHNREEPTIPLLRQIRHVLGLTNVALWGLWARRRLPAGASRGASAEWLHQISMRALRALDIGLETEGERPTIGLVVSNHLSYLDIIVYSAALPCVFVSKAEVEQWPVFGRYARWAGSVFVRRHDRSDAARANASVADTLREGVPVLLFPEGTTTDGQHLLRFHSTMLQPAIDVGAAVTPASIRYELAESGTTSEVAWWGAMPLLPHMWRLLGLDGLRAHVVFGEPTAPLSDRKQFSAVLHERVMALRESGVTQAASR